MSILKYPKLLQKKYLNQSPLWKSYILSAVPPKIPLQYFKINKKLYSAYTISQSIKATNKRDHETMNTIREQYYKYYFEQKNKPLQNKYIDYEDLCMEKTFQYLKISQFAQKNYGVYVKQFIKAFHSIYTEMSDREQQISKINTVQDYLNYIVKMSKQENLDDLDYLLLQTLQYSQLQVPQLYQLKYIKFANNTCSFIFCPILIKILLSQMKKQKGWLNISLLKKLITILRVQDKSEQLAEKDRMRIKMLTTLLSLMQQKYYSKNIDLQLIIEWSNKIMPISKQKKSKIKTYLDIFCHHYLLFVDWFAIKLLFSTDYQQFQTNIQQFCNKIKCFNLNQILSQIKRLENKNMTKKISMLTNLSIKQQFCQLQILNNLYNSILLLEDTQAISKDNKNAQQKQIKTNMRVNAIQKLRYLMKQKQDICKRLIDKQSKPIKNKTKSIEQQIKMSMDNIRYVQTVIDMVDSNPIIKQNKRQNKISLSSQIILKFAVKSIQSISKINIILIQKDDLLSIWKVMREVMQNQLIVIQQKSIKQYYKKIQKLVTFPDNNQKYNNILLAQQKLNSTMQAKLLWKQLVKKRNQNQQDHKIQQIKQRFYLLSYVQNAVINKQQQQNKIVANLLQFFDLQQKSQQLEPQIQAED